MTITEYHVMKLGAVVVHAGRPTNTLRGVEVVVDFGAGAATDLYAVAIALVGLGSVIASLAVGSLETAVLGLGRALSLVKR